MYAKQRILVTGGLGFLGSSLAHALVGQGARVRVLDALLPLYGGNPFNIDGLDIEVTQGDVRDADAVQRAVQDCDVVFHIAAQTSHVDSMDDPLLDLDMNCRGNLIVLDAVRRAGCRLVYAGTRGQYGRVQYTPVDEKHPMQPTDMYGIHKMAAEQQCLLWGRVHGFAATSLRINNTYGPRHQMKHGKYGILNWFVRLALDDKPITVYEPGHQLRDYNYVDDVTAAFLLAGSEPAAVGEVFNLGSGAPVRFVDMVDAIVATAGSGRREMIPWPRDREVIEVGDYVADYAKIERMLGWRPQVSLEEGLRRTVGFYRAHGEHYWKGVQGELALGQS
jgi:UDP-glucose 4-epimerase